MDWKDLPSAPKPGQEICALDAIDDGVGREFEFGDGDRPFKMFIIRQGASLHAYVNACAHFGVPLNSRKDHRFVTEDRRQIICQVHYAKYAIDDGRCLSGECNGEGLKPIPVFVRDEVVIIGE
jgi:nitrite reductase/ring-hydroxylating ferredoxin subunit